IWMLFDGEEKVVWKKMDDELFCIICFPATDRQPGWMVYRGDGKTTVGGVRIIEDLRCAFKKSNGRSNHVLAGAVYSGLRVVVRAFYLFTERQNKKRTRKRIWNGHNGRE